MIEKKQREVAGRTRCPICGTACEVRVNKNLILYTICPNGHQTKLSGTDSKEARAALYSGRNYSNGIINFYPTEKGQENGRNEQRKKASVA